MSPYKLRRCSVCGKYHASYLVPDGKGGNLYYCTSCWKAWQAAQHPAGEKTKGLPTKGENPVDPQESMKI